VSLARIAELCGVKARQISDHVHALAAAGVFRLSERCNGRSQLIEFPLHPTLTGYAQTPALERGGDYPQPLSPSAGVTGSEPLRSSAPTPALQRANPCAGVPPNPYNPVKNPAPLTSTDGIPGWFVDKVNKRLTTNTVDHPSMTLADQVSSREAFVAAKRKAAGK
jgi:hypothetical protein